MSSVQSHRLFPNNNNNNPTINFEFQRRSSTEFLSSHPIPPRHYNNTLLKEIRSELNAITSPVLLPIIRQFNDTIDQIQGFFSGVKGQLLEVLNTLIRLIMFSSNIDVAATTTVLDTFNRLMARVSGSFTDDSLDSLAEKAGATLRELRLQARKLDDDLENARVFARRSNVIFSTFVISVTAVVSPLVVITVGPCLQSIDSLWNYEMENSVKEKQKHVETMLFITHSAIFKVGEIKDLVGTLGILVNELKDVGDVVRRFSEVEKAVADVLKEVKLAELKFA